MGWILGFGIPIGYLVTGLYMSRMAWRSRYKRELRGYMHEDDTTMLCVFMVMFWPLVFPIYFGTVTAQKIFKANDIGELFEKFYTHNLPVSKAEKELLASQKDWDQRLQIHRLEIDAGLEPSEKTLPRRPEKGGYDRGW